MKFAVIGTAIHQDESVNSWLVKIADNLESAIGVMDDIETLLKTEKSVLGVNYTNIRRNCPHEISCENNLDDVIRTKIRYNITKYDDSCICL